MRRNIRSKGRELSDLADTLPREDFTTVGDLSHAVEYANSLADEYIPSQLIMIGPNKIAQYWVPYGHISFYERIDLDELVDDTFRGGGRRREPGKGEGDATAS